MSNPRLLVCGTVLQVLYRAIRVLSHVDSRVREELQAFPEGYTIHMQAAPQADAPSLTVQVMDGTIRKAPAGAAHDISIVFKNEKMAFRVFTGRMSIAGAYAAHAFTLRGSIYDTMGLVRVVDLAEGYLFPGFISRRLLKEVPKKQYPTPLVYLRLIPGT
ncbi:MAG: hypothetical protein PUC06_03870 [Oscillospiraceae bacterium]|nr:hypothetical protein [Oscillospiraceae bacterium]